MKPMSDLCWVCQQNSAAITHSANRPEEEKSAVSGFRKFKVGACGHGFKHILLHADKQAEQHLDVTTERSVYKAALDKAMSSIVAHFTSNGEFSPPPPGAERPSNTTPIEAHYSFDMAQQIFYPNDPLHPGPMYFLTPHKCAIFGVCCEAIPHQINYLIDEAVDMGKGSNAIVSMLHHYFKHHGLGEDGLLARR